MNTEGVKSGKSRRHPAGRKGCQPLAEGRGSGAAAPGPGPAGPPTEPRGDLMAWVPHSEAWTELRGRSPDTARRAGSSRTAAEAKMAGRRLRQLPNSAHRAAFGSSSSRCLGGSPATCEQAPRPARARGAPGPRSPACVSRAAPLGGPRVPSALRGRCDNESRLGGAHRLTGSARGPRAAPADASPGPWRLPSSPTARPGAPRARGAQGWSARLEDSSYAGSPAPKDAPSPPTPTHPSPRAHTLRRLSPALHRPPGPSQRGSPRSPTPSPDAATRTRACSHCARTLTRRNTHTLTHTHTPARSPRAAPRKGMNIPYSQALVTAKLLATSKLSMWGVSLNSEVEN